MDSPPTLDRVKRFWERHPVAAAMIPADPGTREFYAAYDRLRAQVEPPAFAAQFYQYTRFANAAVLDVGCGNGHVLQRYAEQGADVVGVDLTRTAIDLTRRRFELAGCPVPALIEASAESLPFPANAFAAVSCMGVVHHTPNDAGAVRELIRVLRPGGRLMVMVYHRDSALYRLMFPLARGLSRTSHGWTMQRLVNNIDGAENPLGKVYSRRELARLVAGCDIMEMTAGHLRGTLPPIGPFHDPERMLPPSLLSRLARRFGSCLYVAAVKRAETGT
jgi:SAM-dependent methyltransferase